MNIRPYRDADFCQLLRVWEESLPLDALPAEELIRKILLDENRSPESLLVAEIDGELAGFLLGLGLRHPIENVGLLEHRGFITAFGVLPERRRRGIGRKLFAEAEARFRTENRREVAIAPYPPNYIIPGVDKKEHAAAIQFLNSLGYAEYLEAIAMDAAIGQFQVSEEIREKERALAGEGIEILPLTTDRLVAFLEFLENNMPGDWVEVARDLLRKQAGRSVFDSVWIAAEGDGIAGYCQFDGEHFGPFGIADRYQGRGIGTVLLARTLLQMRKRGHHSAYVLWTGERAANGIYARLGFHVTRRLAVMRKRL